MDRVFVSLVFFPVVVTVPSFDLIVSVMMSFFMTASGLAVARWLKDEISFISVQDFTSKTLTLTF